MPRVGTYIRYGQNIRPEGYNPTATQNSSIERVPGQSSEQTYNEFMDRPYDSSLSYSDNMSSGQRNMVHSLRSRERKRREEAGRRFLTGEIRHEAKDFRKNLGEFTQGQYQGLLPYYNKALKEGTRNIREGAASRGLLRSGVRAEKEGDLRSGLASSLAGERYEIQRAGEGMAREREKAAAAQGLANMQAAQQRADDYTNMAMANLVARREAFGAAAAGLGYGAGAYLGSRDPYNPFRDVTAMQTIGPGLIQPARIDPILIGRGVPA